LKNKILVTAFLYITISIIIFIIGVIQHNELLQFFGLMFLACTFLPMPADTYIFYVSTMFSPLMIGFLGGLINAIAVLLEKKWLQLVIRYGVFKKISFFFAKSTFTKYTYKFMFPSLVISAFSFIPFEPFRLVAVVKDYPDKKYFIASFIGRGIRYFLLAFFGRAIFSKDLLYLTIFLSLGGFIYGLYKMIKKKLNTITS